MKSRVGYSFLALAGLVLLVGLGCLTTTVQPTAAPADRSHSTHLGTSHQ